MRPVRKPMFKIEGQFWEAPSDNSGSHFSSRSSSLLISCSIGSSESIFLNIRAPYISSRDLFEQKLVNFMFGGSSRLQCLIR